MDEEGNHDHEADVDANAEEEGGDILDSVDVITGKRRRVDFLAPDSGPLARAAPDSDPLVLRGLNVSDQAVRVPFGFEPDLRSVLLLDEDVVKAINLSLQSKQQFDARIDFESAVEESKRLHEQQTGVRKRLLEFALHKYNRVENTSILADGECFFDACRDQLQRAFPHQFDRLTHLAVLTLWTAFVFLTVL